MTFSPGRLGQRDYEYVTLSASSAKTETGQTAATFVGCAPETINIFVNCTDQSGSASPTATISLEVSPDGGTTWYTSASASALTGTGQRALTANVYDKSTPLTSLYRVKWVITGTTPSFTFDVLAYVTRN